MMNVHDRFQAFAHTEALVLGDVMLDAYLWGRVDRISPEAPVPVVHVQERSAGLAGAANVALNLRALGARPMVMTMMGGEHHAARLDQSCSTAWACRRKACCAAPSAGPR